MKAHSKSNQQEVKLMDQPDCSKVFCFFFNDPSTPCICDVAILWKTSSLSRSVQCILGTVSTSNNGGFTSIRTKVLTDMYFPKKKKKTKLLPFCVLIYILFPCPNY